MKRFYHKEFYNSILFKLISIFTLLIPVIGMFIYNNYESRSTLLEQVQGTHKNMLESYWFQVDNQLNNATTLITTTALFDNDPQLAMSNNETDSMLAKQRISLTLSEKIINIGSSIDMLFVYTDDSFISGSQTSLELKERSDIQNYVLNTVHTEDAGNLKSNWQLININNHFSMLKIIRNGNGVLSGAYVNLDRLSSHFVPNQESESLKLVAAEDVVNSKLSQHDNALVVTASSSVAPITFIEIIPFNELLRTLPFMQKYVVAISVIVALMLPFVFYILRITVVQPLQKLNKAMKHIQRGDLQYRIPHYRTSNEIAIVNKTFNQMIDEVQHLKISVYEEEIKAQKSQLRNLQLQIQPHFIINSLNMVYNLLENGDSQTAQKLIVHSVDFYRYMIKIEVDLLPLYEEIKHVNTYLQIQAIRYKDRFTYSIETDKMIEDMLVPPMLVQNFVENSIKYAIQSDKSTHISVKIVAIELDFYPFAKIMISDSGNGYPPAQLEQLNQGKAIVDCNAEHIGISNTLQRLSLLFEGKAQWRFYNQNGAVSELILPALFQE